MYRNTLFPKGKEGIIIMVIIIIIIIIIMYRDTTNVEPEMYDCTSNN